MAMTDNPCTKAICGTARTGPIGRPGIFTIPQEDLEYLQLVHLALHNKIDKLLEQEDQGDR